MKLRDYLIRRILLAIPVVLGVLIITFILSYWVGNPIALYITERTPEDRIAIIMREHGLDQPLYIQFFYYIRDIFTGDWGYSRTAHMDVTQAIAVYLPATIELSLVAMVIAIVVGIPLGIISATKKDKPVDHVLRVIALAGVSMPIFWFALMLKMIFFFQLNQMGLPSLPESGRFSVGYVTYGFGPTGFILIDALITGDLVLFFDAVIHLVLPASALAYLTLAVIMRMMRSSMLEVLKEDYITLARAKGLRERVVIYKHALRNALIPTITVIGLAFGGLMSGAVLTETIFNWYGMGQWSTTSIMGSDIPSISAFVLIVAIVYVTANLLVDMLYGTLDPRIRYG
ncbi:MAG: ABC transporter permease [Candidatus Thorarchaeota archaeon]